MRNVFLFYRSYAGAIKLTTLLCRFALLCLFYCLLRCLTLFCHDEYELCMVADKSTRPRAKIIFHAQTSLSSIIACKKTLCKKIKLNVDNFLKISLWIL